MELVEIFEQHNRFGLDSRDTDDVLLYFKAYYNGTVNFLYITKNVAIGNRIPFEDRQLLTRLLPSSRAVHGSGLDHPLGGSFHRR